MATVASWTCTLCTFAENKSLSLQCEMCGNQKSSQVEINRVTEIDDSNTWNNNYINYQNQASSNTVQTDKNNNYPQNVNDYDFNDTSNTNSPSNSPSNSNNNNEDDEIDMDTQKEEINMIFHANNNNSDPIQSHMDISNKKHEIAIERFGDFNDTKKSQQIQSQPKPSTNKKWNCVMCTLENEAQRDYCEMCNGPSSIKNELWGKRICRVCNTINVTDTTHCKNCNQILTGIVDYNENAQLLFKEDKKPKSSHDNHQFNNQNGNHNYLNGFNNYPNYDDEYYDDFGEVHSADEYNNHNSNNKNQKKHNKGKKHKNINVWNWGGFNNNMNNNNMNNNSNAFGSGFSFGGMDLFGSQGGNKNEQKQLEDSIPRVNVCQEYEKAMKSGNISRLRLIRRRQFVENDDGDKHFRICESQFMRSNQRNIKYNQKMLGNGINGQEINKTIGEVEYVITPKLIKKFEAKKKYLMDAYGYKDESKLNIVLAWHGTAQQNVDGIVEHNFDLSRLSESSGDTGWYGRGIYFSEYASISSGYGDSLLLCKVILGKAYRMKTNQQQTGRRQQQGYDCHLVVDQNNKQYGQEIVIFDVDQILPCYIVKY